MRRLFALVLLVSIPVWALTVPDVPNAEDRQKLKAAIDAIDAVKAQDQAQGRGIMQDIEFQIGLRDKAGKHLRPALSDPNYKVITSNTLDQELGLMQDFDVSVAERFHSLSEQKRAEYAAAAKAHKRYQEELRPLCAKALEIAQKAFHISPRNTEGTIVNGPPPPKTDDDFTSFQGRRAVWKPVYHETQEPTILGFTDPDGHVGITLMAFKSADFLGFVLHHESLHFDDLLDAEQAVKNEPAAEVRHREAAKRLINSVFNLEQTDISNNDDFIHAARKNAEKWREFMANGFNPWKKSHRVVFPGNYKSLWMKSLMTDDGEAYASRPEPTPEQADMSFLDSWHQAAAAIVAAKARTEEEKTAREKEREQQARLDKERLEREREEQERANQERKDRAFQEEMDSEAANCGYKIRYDADKAMLGFGAFRLGRNFVPTDFGDLKVVFLMTRTCNEIQSHPHEPAPRACNGAADHLLAERISRGDFMPKLEYLAATASWDGAWVKWDRCIQEILNNAGRITDTKSFNVVMASYHKRESKRLNEEDKRRRKREEEQDQNNDSSGGRSRPEGGDDSEYMWDPQCQCRIKRQ